MITTRKRLYPKMSAYKSDAVYHDILWHTYKRSVQMDLCDLAPIWMLPIYIGCACISCYYKLWFIAIIVLVIYGGHALYTTILDPIVDKGTVEYLNKVMKKNAKMTKNNRACLLKEDDGTLRIVVDGIIVGKKFSLQDTLDKYQVLTTEYFFIAEYGHVQLHNDYVLMYDGQIVSETEGVELVK